MVAERSKVEIFTVPMCLFGHPKELLTGIVRTISGPYSNSSVTSSPVNYL